MTSNNTKSHVPSSPPTATTGLSMIHTPHSPCITSPVLDEFCSLSADFPLGQDYRKNLATDPHLPKNIVRAMTHRLACAWYEHIKTKC